MKIKICKKYTEIEKLQNKLSKRFPEDSVSIKSCIGMCKKCKSRPLARIKKKKFKAKGINSLIKKVETA